MENSTQKHWRTDCRGGVKGVDFFLFYLPCFRSGKSVVTFNKNADGEWAPGAEQEGFLDAARTPNDLGEWVRALIGGSVDGEQAVETVEMVETVV